MLEGRDVKITQLDTGRKELRPALIEIVEADLEMWKRNKELENKSCWTHEE